MGRVLLGRRSGHRMSALVCGLDVHKDSTYAPILDGNGKIVSQRRMSDGNVLSYLSDYRIDRIGMESSNQVASLYRELTRKGYTVSVSHSKKTRYIAEAKIKSDRVDSRARLACARFREVMGLAISGIDECHSSLHMRRRSA